MTASRWIPRLVLLGGWAVAAFVASFVIAYVLTLSLARNGMNNWRKERNAIIHMSQFAYAATFVSQPTLSTLHGLTTAEILDACVRDKIIDTEIRTILEENSIQVAYTPPVSGQAGHGEFQVVYPGTSAGPEDDIRVIRSASSYNVVVPHGMYWKRCRPYILPTAAVFVLVGLVAGYCVLQGSSEGSRHWKRAITLGVFIWSLGLAVCGVLWDGDLWLHHRPIRFKGEIICFIGIMLATGTVMVVLLRLYSMGQATRRMALAATNRECFCGYDLKGLKASTDGVRCPECGCRIQGTS